MNFTRLELTPDIVLDARRAAFLRDESLLAVADLHLGYAWTHRARGQIFPLSVPEDTLPRLLALLDEYKPATLALLGDIIHGAAPVAEFREQLFDMLAVLRERVNLVLIAGNHDRYLPGMLEENVPREFRAGPHILMHGDGIDETLAVEDLREVERAGGRIIVGHEHPAIVLGDNVAHSARVPCFLESPNLLVLPAFSEWAAGGNVRKRDFFSGFLKVSPPERAVAILAGKLLPVAL